MLKAILFDVDGTLAETEEFHRRAFNGAFSHHGIDASWSVAQYRELLKVTGGKERLQAYFHARGLAISQRDLELLHRTKNELYAQNMGSGLVGLRPGVLRLMREAADAGCKLAIATTTSLVNVDALLRQQIGAHWNQDFSAVVAGDQVAKKKPAPDVYVRCLELLRVAPSQAIALEDSPAGVAAARQAGILVLATPSLYTAGEDFSQADVLVPSLGDPAAPWDNAVPGFSRRWVELSDLQRLAARGEIAPGTEMAQ